MRWITRWLPHLGLGIWNPCAPSPPPSSLPELDALGEGLDVVETTLPPAIVLEQPFQLVEAELERVAGDVDEGLRLGAPLMTRVSLSEMVRQCVDIALSGAVNTESADEVPPPGP